MTTPLLALLFALSAHAEPPAFDGSFDVTPPPAEQPAPTAAPDAGYSEHDTSEDDRPAPKVVIKPHESTRFNAEDHAKMRSWLLKLCREDAVAPEASARVKVNGKTRTSYSAGNKQGSLVLLLDNYAELASLHDKCELARKKNPEACLEKGRMPKPGTSQDLVNHPALAVSSTKFWNDVSTWRAPAGIEHKTDLVRESDAQLSQLKDIFKKDFFDLRDVADIKSGAKAAEIAKTVREHSTCGTRAVAERFQK